LLGFNRDFRSCWIICSWLRWCDSVHFDSSASSPLTVIDDIFRTLSLLMFIPLFSCQRYALLYKLR